ncbi:RagB/SusD family nutrient uptake outer membrane protein [Pararcticibacter amylolyticus]|uniref:RagB/SusD family nutrient uptake outer membrane protein n=1 Tax=Pararcticibacter amylolyticus TaxID=2173175 RepID=A0A2U2PFB8_9SPHI|nr:RagB/SusD family nutrient uptake outer membrane protein [Pararcticibacter amylolyticus]PWG80073.1 RagB/SusD family nutrient uptake outer membrane protein [Pararcticibacter amylolyticus]
MKRRVYFLLNICLVLLWSSCSKDYLNTNPTDRVSEETAFQSIDNARKALNGIYRILYTQYTNQHRDGQGAIMINLDAMGEDYVRTNASYVYHYQSYRWTAHRNVADANVNAFTYAFYYIIVSNANMIITNIESIEGAEEDKKVLRGEALALRGWAHFQLVQLYGKRYDATAKPNNQPGVPIVVTASTKGQPRATVEEVYTQINSDLDAALENLSASRANKTHVNANVVKGFKARVALAMQDWDNAVKYAREARTGAGFLMTNAQYLQGFSRIDNPEWMWGIVQPSDQVPAYGSFFAYMSANFNSAFTRVNPKCINSQLYAKIPAGDIRKKLWWDGTTADAVNFPGVLNTDGTRVSGQTRTIYQHRKYLVPDYNNRAGDIPYMRIAEMYLIEAEALARSGKDSEAASALLPLAVNRNPSYTLSTNTGAALIEEIMIQRRVELWGEGFRFLDLKRTNADLDRRNTNHKLDVANIMYVPAGDNSWQWLIPQDEIDANEAMGPEDQNP